MAREERKKEDLFIKPKRRAKNFFVTSSAKMDEKEGISKTTISSSVFTSFSASFSAGDFLLDSLLREQNGSILYMLQEMQQDIDDVYNEVSASAFQASFFPFATIDSGSFGLISSSLIPDKDGKHHLGAPSREWENLHIDGTAHIDSLAMGTTVTAIKDEDNMSSNSATALATQQSIKKYVDDNAGSSFTATGISGSFTSLSASIATDINNAGGADFSSVGESIVPTIDNKMDLGTSAKEFRNLYIDGTANIDGLSATSVLGTMSFVDSVIKPSVATIKSISNNMIDMRQYSVANILIKGGAFSITTARPAAPGQEITIIGLTAGKINHTSKSTTFTFSFANGNNLNVSAGQAYKFILDANDIWRQIH